MLSKLRLLALVGLLAGGLAPMLSGCGSECGPGTVEVDGQCELAAEGCAEGTRLENGVCLLDETGCGNNTVLMDGVCVPNSEVCQTGTTFDEGTETCVPDTEVVCGEGTEPGAEGTCVPSDNACGPMTNLDDDGRCVVSPSACTAGTELDPNTGECLVVEEACGPNLALDGDTGQCVATGDVCETPGTAFDPDTGLCLPDACQEGDVLVNGVCISPAEELAANADLIEIENNDPDLGGAAESLTTPAVGEDPFVFTGAIGEASDIDGDGSLDQDVDVFTFDATAGQWFQLMVQSTGLPAPAFTIEGPDGYMRWSNIGTASAAARKMVAPADGTYTVTVLPALVLQSGGEVSAVGADDWSYVGSLEAIDAAAPVDADISSGTASLTGEFTNLSDNLFNLAGIQPSNLVSISANNLGEQAEGVLQVWADATTLVDSYELSEGNPIEISVPDTGTALVLVDWLKVTGPAVDFDLTATVTGSVSDTTLADGASESLTVTASVFDQIVASQTNAEGADLDVVIADSSGTEVASGTLADTESLSQVVFADGDYTVTFTNNSGADVTASVTAKVVPPNDLGALPTGTITTTQPTMLADGEKTFYRFEVAAGEVLEWDHDNAEDEEIDFTLWDTSGAEFDSDSFVDATSDSSFGKGDRFWYYVQAPTTLLLEVEATTDLTDQTVRFNSITPDDLGTLTPSTTVSATSTRAVEEDHSGFLTVTFSEVMSYAGTLSPGAGEDVDFYLYDLDGNELAEITESGGDVSFGGFVDPAGTYLVRVEADEAVASYSITMDGIPAVEDLGSLSADSTTSSTTLASFAEGQQYKLNFTAPAGQIIEISQDNVEGESHDYVLSDGAGNELTSGTFLNAMSGFSPEYVYYYTGNGGDFAFNLIGDDPSTDQTISVRLYTPTDLGTLDTATPISYTSSTALGEEQIEWSLVTVNSPLEISGSVSNTGGASTDFFMATDQWSIAGSDTTPTTISSFLVGAGTYLVGVGEQDALTSYTLDLSAVAGPDYLTQPGVTIPDNDPAGVSNSIDVSNCASVGSVEVYVDIEHSYRGDLEVILTSADGTSVTLHANTGSFSDDIFGWYPTDLTVDGPGTLGDFAGGNGNGNWTLSAVDSDAGAEGTLNAWGLNLTCQ